MTAGNGTGSIETNRKIEDSRDCWKKEMNVLCEYSAY